MCSHLKKDKIEKGLNSKDGKTIVDDFLDGDHPLLLINGDSGAPTIELPERLPKNKWFYILKKDVNSALPSEKIADAVTIGEMCADPLEHMERVVREIYIPQIQNQVNQGFGEVEYKEIMIRLNSFLASVSITLGQTKGETCLPLPPLGVAEPDVTNKDLVHTLEGGVVTWTSQIKAVLDRSHEDAIKQGLNPTPDQEVKFWESQSANLNAIFTQLKSKRMRHVMIFLDQAKSSYCGPFAGLCKEVFAARLEANNNVKFLRTLESWFRELNSVDDLIQLHDLYKPMMHITLLIWKNSKHYNSPNRLRVLIRKICNAIINQCCSFVSGKIILEKITDWENIKDASEAVTQLEHIIEACKVFKETYMEYKQIANAECPNNTWNVQSSMLFTRLDSFLERCRDNLDITRTVVQFSQLAEIEIGGTKGKTLTIGAQSIWSDFQKSISRFEAIEYDMMDVSSEGFASDYYEFRQEIKELERRLSSLLVQAFDDAACMQARFNLLDSFKALLERPNIESEIEKRIMTLISNYGIDLTIVQDLFLSNRDEPDVANNKPPVSGAISWCKGLIERIYVPYVKLQKLSKMMNTDESKEILKRYHLLRSTLEEYVVQKVGEWGRDVENASQSKLRLPLLKRERESKYLHVNFSSNLIKLLREVKYFLSMELVVPESAVLIFNKTNYFRSLNHGLDRVVSTYNNIIKTMLPVEVPLLKEYVDAIDKSIQKGVHDLNWNSDGLEIFVDGAKESCTAADNMMTTLKTNLNSVDEILSSVSEEPLLIRQAKPISPNDLAKQNKDMLKDRYKKIKEGGLHIHHLLKESMKALKVSQHSSDWLAYMDFANNVVSEGLASNAVKSLDYLLQQLKGIGEDGEDVLPMLEIQLKLINNIDVVFNPTVFDKDEEDGDEEEYTRKKPIRLRSMLDSWITSILNGGSVFKRLDTNSGDYRREVINNVAVREKLMQINAAMDGCESECAALRDRYAAYNYLWTVNIQDAFETFKQEATIPGVNGKSKSQPNLKMFDKEITKYRELQKEINNFESNSAVTWLSIDLTPINQALASWVAQWVMLYMNHVREDSIKKLTDLSAFIAAANTGLQSEVIDGDTDSLMAAMAHVRDVRVIKEETESMFKPLHQAISMLKKQGQNIEDIVVAGNVPILEYLEAAPQVWRSTHRRMLDKKESITGQQNQQADEVKNKLDEFFLEIREFRNKFRKEAPFTHDGPVDEAYASMDGFIVELKELQVNIDHFSELEELFELPSKPYPEAIETLAEMKQLKELWDFHAIVDSNYEEWGEMLWNDIDTEVLATRNKQTMKALRQFTNTNPVTKAWAAYTNLEAKVKAMDTTLPLVEELHSKAMRERHWNSLKDICQSEEAIDVTNPTFSLNSLIELGVQDHADDIEEIIEIANKELKITRKLKDIGIVWKKLELIYRAHKDTEIMLVTVTDDIIEALEDNQLELQTMIGMGKFVDHFRSEVEDWQYKLGQVETVLKIWSDVTKQWAALETIFLGSADIRAQLPEDTKRFEGIDSQFKDLCKSTEGVPNVIDACCQEGREELLIEMANNLELCQRALNEYLDMKKKIFPRFYFVSNVALLDMLSNGNNPPRIMKHLGSCYDALCNLDFIEGSQNIAHSMMAKDGEIVEFHEPFEISGAVEDWLNRLTEHMRECLKRIVDHAYNSAAEWEVAQPRHEWLYNYPAQGVLSVASCIMWSEETEAALEEYLGGNEDSVKQYLEICNSRLAQLILLVRGKLEKLARRKIIATITLDVHGRDVVKGLIAEKTEGPEAFAWSRQLRFYYAKETKDIQIRICDYRTLYSYEYIGNTGRLVITPLTDRCYITLTTALRLMLSGAPAGPAGTGKTETTKDLGRAIALCVYVFNCSPQMNFRGLADIFKGLAQSGSWGCFDEFNRISIDVLSVVATQVKTVQDAIVKFAVPANRDQTKYADLPPGQPPVVVGEFSMLDDAITLIPTCGFFITMNPGYAGRTELPENLKTLFRSCAMIRPDLAPICENMLMSEGYQAALVLSVKFTTLYGLCKALLSPQHHYDWGLRAVKSVLVVAGKLLRANPDLDEECVLMRALRDFNTPKIPAHDMPIFMRLIKDLFPTYADTTPPVVDEDLKAIAAKVCIKAGLQPVDELLIKVVQFQELLDVRHSVMLLGPAGCGKTTIWQTLLGCHNHGNEKRVAVAEVVNPKAVFNEELFGYMTLAKDWKDGCLSIVMRGMSTNDRDMGYYDWQTTKWMVLDDDVDTLWIESMNTVMDANKMLTLVSNERIPLTPAMRMVFEIDSIDNGSPATVSRAGMLYINETDIGWRPYVDSWIERQPDITEEGIKRISRLVDKYMLVIMENTRKGLKKIVPIRILSQAMSTCSLLQVAMTKCNVDDLSEEALESLFCYCLQWAFGGCMASPEDKNMFDNMFTSTFTDVKYPKGENGENIFDYYFNTDEEEWTLWSETVIPYEPDGTIGEDVQFFDIVVPTLDSTRISTILGGLVGQGQPVMFVGGAGTGKSTLMNSYFSKAGDDLMKALISMNYFTDSASFQAQLEGPIDKRSGKIFGPPTGKKLVYFVDDINLPYIEDYGTQNSLSLMRQSQDYRSYFDRENLGLKKEVVDTMYVAAMNPTAGSFTITERLQRHFATFTVAMPTEADQRAIYGSILSGHLEAFDASISAMHGPLVDMTMDLLSLMIAKFLPSAVKFVYNWNLRELDNVFNGLTRMNPDHYHTPLQCMRLYIHEINRTFSDRLNDEADLNKFRELLNGCYQRAFKEVKGLKEEEIFSEPLIFTEFHNQPGGIPTYLGVPDKETITDVLNQKLEEYNESNTIMELVLFRDAVAHVCRIARIIAQPRGNALLIGVGGSGKQSLSRLATFICGYEVRQLSVSSRYGVEDFKEELRQMYITAGQKGLGLVFLLTDSHIVDEKFLIYVNDLLSNGYIPDLFPQDELDNLVSSCRNAAKQAGIPDTPDHLLKFFIDRVRSLLHVVLCFSPVGDTFRIRARRFPGLVNCTTADRFFGWPEDALQSVGMKFLEEVELESDELRVSIANHMAMVHLSVKTKSEDYRKRTKRNNYVTPKSFLELVDFYKALLAEKRARVESLVDRLDTGLATLSKTEKDVAELQVDLTHTMAQVAEKVAATDALMITMAASRQEAGVQQEIAEIEKGKATIAASGAAKIELEAETELAEAKPAMDAAAAAVDVLNAAAITELKGFSKPPNGVDKVMACVQMMYAGEMNKKKHTWPNAQKLMKNVGGFLQGLKDYNAEDMDENLIKRLQPIVDDPVMEYSVMLGKSFAAANLASWAVNCYKYNRIYVKVKPLMDSLNAARATKAAAEASLNNALATVAKVEAELEELAQGYKNAIDEKREVEEQAERCNAKLGLAHRLIGGLSSEGKRWGEEIQVLRFNLSLLVGNVLISSAFVSYIGAFNAEFRNILWKETWLVDIIERGIPVTEGVDPLGELTDESRNAKMYGNGLPADRISTENGSIISQCKRWPLLVDPQLQGIKWLRKREENREGGTMIVLQMSMSNWPRQLEGAIQNGYTVIIENLGEEVDATLDPVLGRAIYRKGRAYYLKFGGEEIEFDMSFQLYLQTKLANPHYKPEIAACCTLVNFTSTEVGLEDQLLARVVNVERADLEAEAKELQEAFNRYKIELFDLEEDLLTRLANAPEDILSDVALIEGLEATKAASVEIGIAVAKGKETEIAINILREKYRPVAAEASMLYFMLTELCNIDYFYQYSLDAYVFFFYKSIDRAEKSDDLPTRLLNLIAELRFTIFTWCSRGLFEKHKMIFLAQLTFKLMQRGSIQCGDEPGLDQALFQFLLLAPKKPVDENPIEWLPNALWYTAHALCDVPGYEKICTDIQEASPRFREWYNQLTPETEKLPLDWSRMDKNYFQKLLVIRTLRPDRMTMAMQTFVNETLPDGKKYTEADQTLSSTQILGQALLDASPETPIFFILSAGVNVVEYVDKMAADPLYMKTAQVDYHNISMGQGQDILAMSRLEVAHKQGHWVILNNIHLMPTWCVELEKKMDQFNQAGSHENMRIFLTAEPSKTLPIGILSRSIKLTNEPPSGLKANLMRSISSFKAEDFDDNEPKTRAILFGLAHFHAVLMERKKFGPMGYNMMYPFGLGDLRDAAICLLNYMESAPSKIPWEDLQYIFGQIIWGGHIVNDNDRLLAMTYQEYYMVDALLDDHELFPYCEGTNISFKTCLPSTHEQYIKHIESTIPKDTPLAFGLHPNAEIEYRTFASNEMFDTLISLQSSDGSGGEGQLTPTEIAAAKMEECGTRIEDINFDPDDIASAIDDVGPFENVFLQECAITALLSDYMKKSLKELSRGFAGELTMSEGMEALENNLYLGRVPTAWEKLSWPSMRSLDLWIADMLKRSLQLSEWTENPNEIPKVTWLSGLIIPESFLTAIKQVTAQQKSLELDKLVTWTEWSKKMDAAAIEGQPRTGAYMSGFYMQGARFDTSALLMAESKPKELFSYMPIVTCSAILSTEVETNGVFSAPTYKTEFRGPTFIFSAQVRTKHPNAKWVLAGVALVMDVGE